MRWGIKKTTDMDMNGDMGMLIRRDMGMLLKKSSGNGDSDGRLFCCENANSLRSQLLKPCVSIHRRHQIVHVFVQIVIHLIKKGAR